MSQILPGADPADPTERLCEASVAHLGSLRRPGHLLCVKPPPLSVAPKEREEPLVSQGVPLPLNPHREGLPVPAGVGCALIPEGATVQTGSPGGSSSQHSSPGLIPAP